MTTLPERVDTTTTRETLHRLAEQVMAPEQRAAIGTIRLQVVPDGFATRWFPRADQIPQRLRVEGTDLIRETDGSGDRETDGGGDREPIAGDPSSAAAAVLYAWYGLGARVLGEIAAGVGPAAGEIVLWPEHFDLAMTVDAATKVNLGFSPGDEFCEQPYVYAGPWQTRTGPFWNAPFGAYRTYDEVRSAGDGSARTFLDEALAEVATS
jgi:hypothetical protein